MTNICLRSLITTAALLTLARPAFSQDTLIPQAGWSLHAVDSQETDGSENAAILAFDGNPATLWATQWVAAAPPPPHDLQIDLGATHTLGGFLYLPRQDGILNGTVGEYQFFVSNDGVNWGSPVATGSFPASSQEQRVTFPAAMARYIRLRALTEVSGYPWTTVAELNLLAAGTTTPAVPQTSGAHDSGSPIPQYGWTLRSVDSQEVDAAHNEAVQAFDGNPNTLWATQWGASAPPPPHELQIDLGGSYTVTGFHYLPRQDGLVNGGIGQYQFYVSADGVNWGSAVAAGSFPLSTSEQQVVFAPKNGRYIRLRALSEITGQPWTVVAELNVLSTSTPVVVTQTPETTGGGNPGGLVPQGDPGGLIPQGDSGGLIPQIGWRLLSVDSQETAAGDNAAVRAFDGNPYSLWATEWGAATPPPPHDLQIDLGGVYSVSGFRYLPRQDGILNGGIGQYQFYVSPDGLNWGPALAAGTFPATSNEQQVVFTATSGRYIRLRALSEVTGQPWTTVAELNVLAASPGAAVSVSDNQVPIAGSVSRSTRVMFTPSADHDTLVTWYGLEIFNASAEPGSSAPVATMNLGKPGVVNGECSVEVGAIVSALTPGSYVVVVSAVGDVGMSRSEGSAFVIP